MPVRARSLSIQEFRTKNDFSGEVRVGPRKMTRSRGVQGQHKQAGGHSPVALAGTDAACEPASGDSAHTSAARAASRNTDTDLAKPLAKDAASTPHKKSKKGKSTGKGGGDGENPLLSLWQERWQLDGGEELPSDAERFVDEVNSYMGLVRTTELLLRGNDEKSTKSLLEMLLEMKYGKNIRARASRSPVIDCLPQAIPE